MAEKEAKEEGKAEQGDVKLSHMDSSGLLRLVNFLYDPDNKHLSSLSFINTRREAFMLSMQKVKEAALNPIKDEHGQKIPLSRTWRTEYLMLTRSVDGKAFKFGVGLAHGQAEEEEIKNSEEAEF
jgi:hypothetical protein